MHSYRLQQLAPGLAAVECSDGEVCVTGDYRELLAFLVREPDDVHVVWSLPQLVSCVMSLLPVEVLRGLGDEKRRLTWEEQGKRYRIYYQPGKFLGVHAGGYGEETTYYELDQFFPDDRDPGSIEEVAGCADELIEAFRALGVERITSLKSPVATIEESGLLDKVYARMPDPEKIPAGCKEYATLADTWGAWISVYQLGYWERAYRYDISSCYPGIAARLPSLGGARYEFSRTMLDGAFFGYVKGTLTVDPDHPASYRSPIVAPVGDNAIGNPVGEIKGHFTLDQVRFVKQRGLGGFELDKRGGGWFVFVKSADRPLAGVMQHYYDLRYRGGLVSAVSKRVMTGIIGRMGQWIKDEPTKYTNPVYHSEIRNGASLAVGAFLDGNAIQPGELISVNTDGCHVARPLSVPRSGGLGKWQGGEIENLLVASPGDVLSGGRSAPVLAAIKADKRAAQYDDLDLLQIAVAQNRAFSSFPVSGGDLLRRKYLSEVVYA